MATLGLIGYAAIAFFALWGRIWVVLELARWGFFFAAMLTYLEAFVLEKWCIYCLWSQGIVATILLVTTGVVVVAVVQKPAGFAEGDLRRNTVGRA